MKGKWTAAAVCALSFFVASAADTWYVAKNGNDTTGDGSEAKPYLTIQKGVDKASSGDTVMVGEGDFDDVGRTVTHEGVGVLTAVVIDKKLTLQGAGRGKTFITGAYGDGTGGFADTGAGAHRCIYAASGSNGSVVRDFTIRKGATTRANTGVNNDLDLGGGVVSCNENTLYLMDCDVLDCRAGEGAAASRDVRACRCRFAGNKSRGGSQVFYRNSYTFNCLFENNGPTPAAGHIFTVVQNYHVVNCTFINNSVDRILMVNSDRKAYCYNCLIVGSKSLDGSASTEIFDLRNVVQTMSSSEASGITKFADKACVWGVGKTLQYLSPASDDWRSVEGNSIVGKGDADLVTAANTGLSVDDLATDYSGNPRKAADGTVSVGCFEPTAVVKLCGDFLFAGGATVTKDGKTLGGEAIPGRWWGLEGGGQVRVGSTVTGDLFGYQVANVGGIEGGTTHTVARFPDNNGDGGFWLTPTRGGLATITAIPATDVKWVDDDADASVADGTEAKPYRTIAAALANVAARGLIKVKPGTYGEAEGTTAVSGKNCRINLSKDVAIRSTDGAEKTVLKGGEGVDAILLSIEDNSRYAHIQGFTLTGCANDPSQDTTQGTTGAALMCNYTGETARNVSEGVHLTDSVVSNNVAIRVCVGGWLERCLLIDNFTTVENMNKGTDGGRGTQAFASILSGCVSYYSAQYFATGKYPTVCTCAHQNCTDINCSFHIPGKDASGQNYRTLNTPNGSTVAINNAMVNPTLDTYNPSEWIHAAGNVSSPGSTLSYTTAVPEGKFFTDVSARDYHPISGSVGLGYGVTTTNKYVRYETGDFNGKPLAYAVNGGKPIPGAFQEVRVLKVSQDASRGTASAQGDVYAYGGETVTVTATPARDDLRLRGWLVDGVLKESEGRPYVMTADLAKPASAVTPVFMRDLYVNANAADDSGDGLAPATAKKLLKSVAPLAGFGDIIHAAPGDYDEGTMLQTAEIVKKGSQSYSPSRIELAAGVWLVSDEGADVTFITGNAIKGENGIRCVAAHAGTVIRGFTLRNGATSGVTGDEYDCNMGGIVLAPKATSATATALIEDCVITNGNARTGGCVAGGRLHRCRIATGYSGAGASLAQYSSLDQCVAVGFSNTGVRNHYGIRSSVVVNTGTGTIYYDLSATGDSVCENSIIAITNNDAQVSGAVHKNLRNCIWNVGGNVAKIDDATCCNVITCAVNMATRTTALASLGLDEFGRPSAGAPSIDRGDSALLANLADALTDIDGNQRIYNAAVDLGACEYVCTNEFTAAVCERRSCVTDASPMTCLADGGLAIPDGEDLFLRWKSRTAGEKAKLTVELASGANLLVYAGEQLLGTLTASGTHELTAPAPQADLRLVASGGAATVASFGPDRFGMALIIR